VDARPIGVFDSGFGGLTVVSEIKRQLPGERIIYFGDTAHLPYGSKSKEVVTGYSLRIAEFLAQKGVKLIVIACNTASSYALAELKGRFSLPLVDVVMPGARAAAGITGVKRVGVIGTMATIKSKAYETAINEINPEIKISAMACPMFVPLVEEGWVDGQVALLVAKEYLSPLKKDRIETLILGCTHYPFLKKIITRVMGLEVVLVDSAEETAKDVNRVLSEKALLAGAGAQPGRHRYFVSDDPEKFSVLGRKFLGQDIGVVEKADI